MIKACLRVCLPVTRHLALAPRILLEEMPDHPSLFDEYRFMPGFGMERVPGGWLVGGEFYPDYLTVGGNTFAIRRTAAVFCHGNGLDIGAGYWPLPGSTPIDPNRGPGMQCSLEDVPPGSQDYVFSSHTLEHIEDWQGELDTWLSKVKPGGVLFLYLPHPECKLWHKDNPAMAELHKWVPEPEIIGEFLLSSGLSVGSRDDGPDHFYSFYVCAQKPA